MKIILVVGLPGSGKTQYAKKRAESENLEILDDPRTRKDLKNALLKNKNIIICDPYLCFKFNQDNAKIILKDHNIEWAFFENNIFKCKRNIKIRMENGDTRLVSNFIEHVSKHYFIPKNLNTISVFE